MTYTVKLLFALSFCTRIAVAQQSNLIVFSEQGEQISVVINGVKQNAKPETNIKVTGLNEGTYKMKVIFADGTTPDVDKTVYVQPSQEITVSVKKNKDGVYVVKPVSMTDIAQAPPPPPGETVIVYSTVPQVQQSTTTSTTTTTTGMDPNATNVVVGATVGGTAVNVNMNVNDGSTMTQQTTYTSTTTTTTTTSGMDQVNEDPAEVYVPGYAGPVGCPMPMALSDFESAKSTISSKSFESSKEEIAKQIAGSNCFTASQVKEVMQLFEFEATKLEFAKYAYSRTYDKGNYFKVNDAFGFESSISELNNYIKGH